MELILPPYTKGNSRGDLYFAIQGIEWKGRKFNQIELKIFWWGNDFNSHVTKIISPGTKFPIALRYKICTSPKLFATYLRNCEPIELKIRSARTQTLVGTVFLPIPAKFLDSESNISDAKVEVNENIFSTRNNIIGTIQVEVGMKFAKVPVVPSLPITIPLKSVCKLPTLQLPSNSPVVPSIHLTKSSAGDSIKIDKLTSSNRTSRSFNDLNKNDRTIIVNYLTGERMTRNEKVYALNELASISPTDSLIEALTGHDSDEDKPGLLPVTVLNRDDKKETNCNNCNKSERKCETTEKDEKNKNNDDIHQSEQKEAARGNGSKMKLDTAESNDNYITFLDGLIHIGHIDALVASQLNSSYFIVIQSFWRDTICTQITQTNLFNYLDLFSILCNRDFVEKIKNNFLILELWERNNSSSERLIGQIQLPLHKYFIALCDMKLFEHLKKSKMPIISNDGWTSIKSLLSNEIIGQIEILLAIGTKEQIEYLKSTRNLNEIKPLKIPTQFNNVETQTSQVYSPVSIALQSNRSAALQSSRSATVEKLNKFIDSLSNVNSKSNNQYSANSTKIPSVNNKSSPQPQVRRTSELLDMLNYALAQKHPVYSSLSDTESSNENQTTSPLTSLSSCPSVALPSFKVNIDVEHALHLSKTLIRPPNKSKHKRNRNTIETEPNSYVTFSTYHNPANNSSNLNLILNTQDGHCYSTQIIEKNCNPIWNKTFYEVQIPDELLMESTKKFELKVMTKQLNDLPQCRLMPTPMDDSIIGTVNIDLTVLLSGLPVISGYYNIVDFSGRINGQIKVTVKPLEDVTKIYNKHDLVYDNALVTSLLGSQCLSRTLKRKFTELDEITQRLKARLNDVTSNLDENEEVDEDDVDDIDEEFEKDLNTAVNDDDEDDYNWPNDEGDSPLYTKNNKSASNLYTKLDSDDSSVSPSTSISTLSSDRVKLIADALKNANISDYEN